MSHKESGFTILELIIAILVMIIGITGVHAMASWIVSYTTLSGSKLTAAYLSQEGIEITRNIRDKNWIDGQDWLVGLSTGEYEADYDDTSLSSYQGNTLKIDNGFYKYGSSGVNTKFRRKITLDTSNPEFLNVKVDVLWEQKGKEYTVSAQENLYNWLR
jgi:hypothetical protein